MATNPLIPTATIVLPGEQAPRTLRLSMRSMAEFDRLTGRNLLFGAVRYAELNNRDVLCLLWACMSHDPKAPSLDELGDALHPAFAMEAMRVLIALIGASFPQPEPGERSGGGDAEAAPFPEAASSGGASGPSGEPS